MAISRRDAESREEFIRAWEGCDSVSKVADRLGQDHRTVRNRAQRLREQGHALREQPGEHGPRGQGSTPEGLGIDPAELAGLLIAFNASKSRVGVA